MGNKENLIQNWNFLVNWGDFQTRKPTVKAGVYAELDILWNYTENELCHIILMQKLSAFILKKPLVRNGCFLENGDTANL